MFVRRLTVICPGALKKKDCRASVGKHTANICVCRAPDRKRTVKSLVTVRKCLPCARRKTYDKDGLSRAPDGKCTANTGTHGNHSFSGSDTDFPWYIYILGCI
jgi:hypothetical protein